jgi:hypothetical protein
MVKESKLASPFLSFSTANCHKCPTIPVYRFTVRSSCRSADRLSTSAEGWPGLHDGILRDFSLPHLAHFILNTKLVKGAVGWHGDNALEQIPLEPLGWHWSVPRRTCRLPSRHLPWNSPKVFLQGKPPSPITWSQGCLIDCESMFNTWCLSGQGRDPSWVQGMQSAVKEITFTSGSCATVTMKCGVRGRSLSASWSHCQDRSFKCLWRESKALM